LSVLLAVAGEPDEVVVVDENAVLALGPFVARTGTAPMADEVAGLVENEYRRRGDAALRFGRVLLGGTLARGERARPVIIASIRLDPCCFDQPIVDCNFLLYGFR
jgi:hypothetical protein